MAWGCACRQPEPLLCCQGLLCSAQLKLGLFETAAELGGGHGRVYGAALLFFLSLLNTTGEKSLQPLFSDNDEKLVLWSVTSPEIPLPT